MSVLIHRIALGPASRTLVEAGDELSVDRRVARTPRPGRMVTIPVARRLRMAPAQAGECVVVARGEHLEAGSPVARSPGRRDVFSPADGFFLWYSRSDGGARISVTEHEDQVIAHVRGLVRSADESGIDVEVRAAEVVGVEGSGEPVHGELAVTVAGPMDELRASQIDARAAGKILVGGSRTSAETLTRARAMGVAGIVIAGAPDKELRDFLAIEERRRVTGVLAGSFGLLVLEGYGRVAFEADLFAWFDGQRGRAASLFGADRRLYVYDAAPPPQRRQPARVGDRVVVHRSPNTGQSGRLLAILGHPHVVAHGVTTRAGLVRLDDGRLAAVPLANLDATGHPLHGGGW